MTNSDYAILAEECKRRKFNLTQLVALANILPFIGYYKVVHAKSHDSCTELTYCGKTRKEWSRVKRQRLTEREKAQIRRKKQENCRCE